MREMFAAAAHFPNSFVRLVPIGFEKIHERNLQAPIGLTIRDSGFVCAIHRTHHLTVDIKLKLFRSRIADPHRFGFFVAGQPIDFVLLEAPFTAHAVHDLHL